jgi:hypothetical protein
LVDEIAPKLTGRNSGHLKIERTELRRGDGAQLARISFVDDLTKVEKPAKKEAPAKTEKKPAPKPTTRRRTTAKKAEDK